MSDLPDPFNQPDCDLRGYEYMPLFGARLFSSIFDAKASDAEFRAAMRLWWAAWQDCPAGSLPNDDDALCKAAGYGRDKKSWMKVKRMALHGFVECSDGRLYHKLISDQAKDAFIRRKKERDRKAKLRAKQAQQAGGTSEDSAEDVPADVPADEQDKDKDVPVAVIGDTTGTGHGTSLGCPVGQDAEVPADRRGEERRGEDSKKESMELRSGADAPPPTARDRLKLEGVANYRRMTGCGEKDAFSQIGRLCKAAKQDYGLVLEAINDAVCVMPLNAMAYLTTSIERRVNPQTPKPAPSAPNPAAHGWIGRMKNNSHPLLDMPVGGNG